jgi:alginate O-acetyltransferase complex protein AlgI
VLFNSPEFAIFFIVTTVLFFLTPYRYRWVMMLAASYFFYMCTTKTLIKLYSTKL